MKKRLHAEGLMPTADAIRPSVSGSLKCSIRNPYKRPIRVCELSPDKHS